MECFAKAQAEDTELCDFQSSGSSFRFVTVPQVNSAMSLVCDSHFVPTTFRCMVFESLHSLTHPGICATQRLITERFVWPGMNTNARKWTKACLQCQRSKIQCHTVTPLSSFATPDARFDQVHIDIVGPLFPSRGYSYLLTFIDRFTRWPEALPMTNITAETVDITFTTGWIAQFGVPLTITSDRGRQFESGLWASLMKLLGCKHLRTTSYHPIANGVIERFHRQLKVSLKAYTPTAQWIEPLPLVSLGIRTALKSDLQCSTAELVYGTTLRLPGEFFQSSSNALPPLPDPTTFVARLRDAMRDLRATPVRTQPQRNAYVSKDLSSCTHVFIHHDMVRKPLQQPYDGPYRVVSTADKHFKVDIKGRQDIVSLDRLKPTHVASTDHDLRTGSELLSVIMTPLHPPSLPSPSSHPPSPPQPPNPVNSYYSFWTRTFSGKVDGYLYPMMGYILCSLGE